MLNQLFTFKSVKEERPFLTFLGVCLVVVMLNVSVDPVSPQTIDSTVDISSSYENTTMVESASLDMNDGGVEAVVLELNQNWSDDGWHVKSIEVVLSYEETAFADLDCDTVSGALSLTSNGQEPDTSTAEAHPAIVPTSSFPWFGLMLMNLTCPCLRQCPQRFRWMWSYQSTVRCLGTMMRKRSMWTSNSS